MSESNSSFIGQLFSTELKPINSKTFYLNLDFKELIKYKNLCKSKEFKKFYLLFKELLFI